MKRAAVPTRSAVGSRCSRPRPSTRERDRAVELARQPPPVGVADVDDARRRRPPRRAGTAAAWPGSSPPSSAWKSRWSWVRLVKTAAANWIAVGAPQLERVRGDLHRAGAVAAVEHRAEVAPAGRSPRGWCARPRARRPPITDLTVPSSPHCSPRRLEQRAHQVGGGRLAVRARHPDDAQLARWGRRRSAPRAGPSPRAPSRTSTSGTPRPSGRSTTSATAPPATACGREVVPVAAEAAHAEEQLAGADAAAVVGEAARPRTSGAATASGCACGHAATGSRPDRSDSSSLHAADAIPAGCAGRAARSS